MQYSLAQSGPPRIGASTLTALCAVSLVLLLFGAPYSAVLGAAGALLVLIVILALFWRPGEPLVLLFVFLYQWLESSIRLFYIHDVEMDEPRRVATAMLLVGLLVQSIGAHLAAGPWRNQYRGLAELQLMQIPQRSWLMLYVKALVVALVAQQLAKLVPPLSQPLLVFAHFKWAAYVIFTFASFYRPDSSRGLWLAVFCLELLFSIGGYFSSFKFVFIFTFLGIALARIKFGLPMKIALGVVFSLAVLFGSVWSDIKGEYRYFVSGGERAQVVLVDFPERVAKITELISAMGWQDVANGFDVLLSRIDYVEYFSDVTTFVPEYRPHTGGELWMDAVTRPFMPRLFNPDKPVIDESELTSTYTGRQVAGFDEGTQISIGYIAESYIDFGKYGMIPLLFMWGLTQGWVYRWLMTGKRSRGLLGIGLSCAIMVMTSSSIGNSSAKLIGGFVVAILVIWLFLRFVMPIRILGLREILVASDHGGAPDPGEPRRLG